MHTLGSWIGKAHACNTTVPLWLVALFSFPDRGAYVFSTYCPNRFLWWIFSQLFVSFFVSLLPKHQK